MVQISPKNIAIASTLILVAVPVVALAVVIAIPSAEVLLNLVWIAALIGTLGLLLAYYWVSVNLWSAGNKAGAVVFLTTPVVVASLLASSVPLTGSVAVTYHIGRIVLVLILAVVALWFGSLVKRIVPEDVVHTTASAPSPPPNTLVLGASALVMTGVLWVTLLLFF
jgi:hypothetical protein